MLTAKDFIETGVEEAVEEAVEAALERAKKQGPSSKGWYIAVGPTVPMRAVRKVLNARGFHVRRQKSEIPGVLCIYV